MKTLILMIAFLLGTMQASKADIIWPTDGSWTALRIGTGFYRDDLGDQTPSSIDLIGTVDSYSAGFWALVENGDTVTEDDIFMFRMRVGGESGRYVWQAHLETDGNANDVEYILQLVQSGNPSDQGVELVKTSVGGPTLDDTEVEKKATAERLGDPSLYSRWTPVAGSATDYFVDIAIPWQILANKTGVAKLEDIRAVLATSSTHSGINKDAPIGADLSLQISNALSDSIPEPAVVTLLLGAGGGLIFFQRIFKRKDAEDVES